MDMNKLFVENKLFVDLTEARKYGFEIDTDKKIITVNISTLIKSHFVQGVKDTPEDRKIFKTVIRAIFADDPDLKQYSLEFIEGKVN